VQCVHHSNQSERVATYSEQQPVNQPSAIILTLAALLGTTSWSARSRHIAVETSRKIIHIGMGLICLSFSKFFQSTGPVQILVTIAALLAITASKSAFDVCTLLSDALFGFGAFTHRMNIKTHISHSFSAYSVVHLLPFHVHHFCLKEGENAPFDTCPVVAPWIHFALKFDCFRSSLP